MRKIIAALFVAILAFGSMYGCVIDDGHGRGRPADHMDHPGNGPGDRDDHHDNRKNDRDDHDRDHH